MSSVKDHVTRHPTVDPQWVNTLWREITTDLTRTKDAIYAEIRNYPPPIPACDAQFNFLLEERAKIFQELGRVGTLTKASLTSPDPLVLLKEFVESSAYLHAAVKQKIGASLLAVDTVAAS